jgi:hypothetical protein
MHELATTHTQDVNPRTTAPRGMKVRAGVRAGALNFSFNVANKK